MSTVVKLSPEPNETEIKVDIINTDHNADEGPTSSQLVSSLHVNKVIPELLLVSKE